jgi:hypothetical protein
VGVRYFDSNENSSRNRQCKKDEQRMLAVNRPAAT